MVSARAAGDSDEALARKVSRVEMKEPLTDATLTAIRAGGAGPKTWRVLELLADESEFAPDAEALSVAPPTPVEGEGILTKAREFAGNYLQRLPDFLCTRTTRRFDDRPARRAGAEPTIDGLYLEDTIASEVSFQRGKESYAAQRVNGQADERAQPGLTTWGEFGGILAAILGGGVDAKTEWVRWEAIDGERVAVFRYSVERRQSHYLVEWCCDGGLPRGAVSGYRGELFIEPASGGIVRLTRRAALPRDFPTQKLDTVVEYRPINIGGKTYICPVKSVIVSAWKAGIVHPPGSADPAGFSHVVLSLSEVRFSAYRRFETSSTLVAEAAPEPAATAVANAAPSEPAEGPASASVGEEPQPPPARDPRNPELPATPPPPAGQTVIRATTRLVDVSALVLDKHGNPVMDLKKEDFEIYDEGKRQNIRLFSGPAPIVPSPVAALPGVLPEVSPSARVFSNRGEEGSRPDGVTILLVDKGTATQEEWDFARGQIVKFLRQVQPGERIGLYKPWRGVGIVYEPTSEVSHLISSIEGWLLGVGDAQIRSTVAGWEGNAAERKECPVESTLNAIAASADHIAGIPGRKNLIWISGGSESKSGPQNCFKEEARALKAVNRANVALYAIDLRGLETVQPDASVSQIAAGDPTALSAGIRRKLDSIAKDQSTMGYMADGSGGRAFVDNDIVGELRDAVAESHAAYALGFYPESPRYDGSYRQLEVKTPGRPDVTVRYGRGYLDASESQDPETQLRDAMQNPLDAKTIALTAEMIPAAGGGYDVRLSIGVADLSLQQGDGSRWQGRIRVALAQRDEVGQQLDRRDDTLQVELTPERYEATRKSGLGYQRAFQPNLAAASLRVVVLDEAGNLGSVTIPLAPLERQLRRRR